jgi:hypothetical protein
MEAMRKVRKQKDEADHRVASLVVGLECGGYFFFLAPFLAAFFFAGIVFTSDLMCGVSRVDLCSSCRVRDGASARFSSRRHRTRELREQRGEHDRLRFFF